MRLICILLIAFFLRLIPYLKFGFLFGKDALGHFWVSRLIIMDKALIPKIDISYKGETGWFTGYFPFFPFHILQASLPLITNTPLEITFQPLVVLVSTVNLLAMFIIYKKFLTPNLQISFLTLTAFFPPLIFYTFIGSFETLGLFFYLTIIKLLQFKLNKRKFIFLFMLLHVMPMTHQLSTFALLAYLFVINLLSPKPPILLSITLLLSIQATFSLVVINFLKIPFIGIPLDLKIYIFMFFLIVGSIMIRRIVISVLKIFQNPKFVLFACSVTLASLSALYFLKPTFHYSLVSTLYIKYFLAFLPLLGIFFYNWYIYRSLERIIHTVFLVFVISSAFMLLAILKAHELAFRYLEFIAPFFIYITALFFRPRRLLLAIICGILLIPTFPEYIFTNKYSGERPFYPISKHDLESILSLCTKNVTVILGEELGTNYTAILSKIYQCNCKVEEKQDFDFNCTNCYFIMTEQLIYKNLNLELLKKRGFRCKDTYCRILIKD